MTKGGFEKGIFERMVTPGNLLSQSLYEAIEKCVDLLETPEAKSLPSELNEEGIDEERKVFLGELQEAVDSLSTRVQETEALKIRIDEVKDDPERERELESLKIEAAAKLDTMETEYAHTRLLILPHSSGFSP